MCDFDPTSILFYARVERERRKREERKMSKERQCTRWFLEPRDSESNAILFKNLGASDDDYIYGVICDDGERHSLIRCLWVSVDLAIRSRRTIPRLAFRVWNQEGIRGKIRLWKFDRPHKKVSAVPQKGVVGIKKK